MTDTEVQRDRAREQEAADPTSALFLWRTLPPDNNYAPRWDWQESFRHPTQREQFEWACYRAHFFTAKDGWKTYPAPWLAERSSEWFEENRGALVWDSDDHDLQSRMPLRVFELREPIDGTIHFVAQSWFRQFTEPYHYEAEPKDHLFFVRDFPALLRLTAEAAGYFGRTPPKKSSARSAAPRKPRRRKADAPALAV